MKNRPPNIKQAENGGLPAVGNDLFNLIGILITAKGGALPAVGNGLL